MAWEPSIGAFYVPVGFIIFIDCMYFLSILLQLRRHPERRYELKESTEEQHPLSSAHVDGGGDGDGGPGSQHQPLTLQLQPSALAPHHAVPLSALENEHTFGAQLMGAAGALGLYATLWVFAAMAVSREHPFDLVFTCLFGVTALALAAFMLGHHCINRQDVRRFWSQACCPGRRAYSAQEDVLLPQPGGATAAAAAGDKADGESAKCGHSSADSSCVNRSAASMRNSAHGSKLTNIHAEAAQCKATAALGAANGAAVLDNSLTEHSLDNEIKMHVAPVEVQFRPVSQSNNPLAAAGAGAIATASRHHKNKARAHRASRLTVLREYAYDVPTSVDGSVQSAPHRRHHYYDMAARNSRRAAYMAYRERHQSQLQQDSSDSASLPRRPRHKGGGGSSVGNGSLVTIETERGGASANSSGKDSAKRLSGSELETPTKAYGVNLVAQNGAAPKENGQLLPLMGAENAAAAAAVVKTGLWKHETTV